MEHVDAASDSAGGIGHLTTSGYGFLAQLEESYEQLDIDELLDCFTQSNTGGAGGMGGGKGFSDQPFFGDDDAGLGLLPALEPLTSFFQQGFGAIDVDNAGGLLPPDPYSAGDVPGMASFLQQGFGPIDVHNTGLLPPDPYPAGDVAGMASFLQQRFGPIDDDYFSNAGFPQLVPYPAVAGDISGSSAAAAMGFPQCDNGFGSLVVGNNHGLLPPVPWQANARDTGSSAAAAVAEFPPQQQAFTSPDNNGGLPLLVPYYPAGEINNPSTTIYTGMARSGFSWSESEYSAARQPPQTAENVAGGFLALAAGTFITRLEEEQDAPLRGFGGLNSDHVCLSILGAFRRALDEEQQLKRQGAHGSLAQMERGAVHGPSRARRGRAVTAGQRGRDGTSKARRQLK